MKEQGTSTSIHKYFNSKANTHQAGVESFFLFLLVVSVSDGCCGRLLDLVGFGLMWLGAVNPAAKFKKYTNIVYIFNSTSSLHKSQSFSIQRNDDDKTTNNELTHFTLSCVKICVLRLLHTHLETKHRIMSFSATFYSEIGIKLLYYLIINQLCTVSQ